MAETRFHTVQLNMNWTEKILFIFPFNSVAIRPWYESPLVVRTILPCHTVFDEVPRFKNTLFPLSGYREEEVSWIIHQWWAGPGSPVQRGQSSSVSTLHQQLWHWGGHQATQRLRRDGFHGGEGKVLHLCHQSQLLTHLWDWHKLQSSDWWRQVAGGRWEYIYNQHFSKLFWQL